VTEPTAQFRAVTRDKPCEICLKPDWCRRSGDGCTECHRNAGGVPGFRLLKVTTSGFGLYRPADQQTPNHARKPVAAATASVQNRRNGPGVTSDTPSNEIDTAYAFQTVEAVVEAVIRETGVGTHGGQWTYQNPDGSPAMVVVRIDTPKPGDPDAKTFRPVHPTRDGWAIGDPPGKLPLFGLPALLTADRVFVVEGEGCCESARSIGLTATTSAHGASSPGKSDWTPLAGRDVMILPDNDGAGRNYAAFVARTLTALSPPARVKIVELPGLPEKGDIADWLAMHECTDPDDLRRIIDELADAAPWYVPTDNAPPTDSLPADEGPPWLTVAEVGALPTYRAGLVPVSTGYAVLDDALRGGFRPECLYTIAGRTGAAKSTLALNVARRAALAGHCVLVCKLEESVTEATWRLHAAAAQVDFRLLLDGARNVTGDERQRLVDGWSLIRTLPIRLSADRSLAAIERISREHITQGGKIIIVDQLGMVRVEGAEVGYQQATIASNTLRLLAVELRVPIVLVCQVNRPAAKDDKTHLTCHDLRDSGAIENDSAAVVLIDKVREPDHAWRAAEPVRYLDFIIGKNRYGPTTDPDKPITLTWFPKMCRIEEAQAPLGTGGAA